MDLAGILERARKELENPDIQEFLAGQYIFADEGQDTNRIMNGQSSRSCTKNAWSSPCSRFQANRFTASGGRLGATRQKFPGGSW